MQKHNNLKERELLDFMLRAEWNHRYLEVKPTAKLAQSLWNKQMVREYFNSLTALMRGHYAKAR